MRILKYYIPYYLAFGDTVLQFCPRVIVSVHSFNPVYEGDVRNFDVGVLSSTDSPVAEETVTALQRAGFRARLVRFNRRCERLLS